MIRLAAVLGRDVARSLSPRLHGAASDALGLELAYVPISCRDSDHFAQSVGALALLGAVGCNVTIPYKVDAHRLAHETSPMADEIGAVNTLCFTGVDRWVGDNTDGPGLLRILEALPRNRTRRVQILGAGGAARAAAWAVRRLEADEVWVTARARAEAVARIAGGQERTLEPIPGATLVISTLPGTEALAEQVWGAWLDQRARPFVVDLAYGGIDADSPLVRRAKAAGLEGVDGRHLLVEQAALAAALWTGGEVSRIRQAMGASIGLWLPL